MRFGGVWLGLVGFSRVWWGLWVWVSLGEARRDSVMMGEAGRGWMVKIVS